jgi:hypothetical protein
LAVLSFVRPRGLVPVDKEEEADGIGVGEDERPRLDAEPANSSFIQGAMLPSSTSSRGVIGAVQTGLDGLGWYGISLKSDLERVCSGRWDPARDKLLLDLRSWPGSPRDGGGDNGVSMLNT